MRAYLFINRRLVRNLQRRSATGQRHTRLHIRAYLREFVLFLVLLNKARRQHSDYFASNWPHLASEVLYVPVNLASAFIRIKVLLYVFASLEQIIHVLHRTAYNAEVVFSHHGNIECRIHRQEVGVI